ncbi:MAG: PLP-dependent aminotransferase family protein [Eubacterium sp.]|nr:PLP-dependent aminotransferase family protein [Eubacterium sp.]
MNYNTLSEYVLTWKPDKKSLKRPIYQSLTAQMEEDIANGILLPGTKLPPQRELANYLGVNFTTITRTYQICELKGLVYGVVGSGTFVSSRASSNVTISEEQDKKDLIDLGFVASFESTNRLIENKISEFLNQKHLSELLNYSYPTGMPHQRAAGANWLSQIGVNADAEHILIVSGVQNGIALVLMSLFEPGNRIAVDKYTFANFIELAKMRKIHLIPIESDDEGISADELEKQCSLASIQGIFLMPSCCNPTTVMISEKRKLELAEVIKKHNLILIEDDIHAFFTAGITAEYKGSIQRLIPENTVYIGGTSKAICSGLRVAYIVSPDRYLESLSQALFNVNVKTSGVDIEIITGTILTGLSVTILKEKIELAIKRNQIFKNVFTETSVLGNPTGFYRWLPIVSDKSGLTIEREIRQNGISVFHSDRFLCGTRQKPQYLRIALSTEESDERFTTCLMKLKNLLKSRSMY